MATPRHKFAEKEVASEVVLQRARGILSLPAAAQSPVESDDGQEIVGPVPGGPTAGGGGSRRAGAKSILGKEGGLCLF